VQLGAGVDREGNLVVLGGFSRDLEPGRSSLPCGGGAATRRAAASKKGVLQACAKGGINTLGSAETESELRGDLGPVAVFSVA